MLVLLARFFCTVLLIFFFGRPGTSSKRRAAFPSSKYAPRFCTFLLSYLFRFLVLAMKLSLIRLFSNYCFTLSNTLSLALFERLLYSNSSALGRMGFLVITLPFGWFPHTHTGNPGGQVHGFSFFLKIVFTILSSREWKVIMQILPSSFKLSLIHISWVALK